MINDPEKLRDRAFAVIDAYAVALKQVQNELVTNIAAIAEEIERSDISDGWRKVITVEIGERLDRLMKEMEQ